MGNGVGSVLGVVAGAAIALIPGVGPVAAVVFFAGGTGLGSGIDAIVDTKTQNSAADQAAEESRQRLRREAEAARITERDRLEALQTTNNENLIAAKLEAERVGNLALAEQDNLAAIALNAQQQITWVEDALEACTEDINLLPGLLHLLNNEHFELFQQQAFAACTTPDALEACQQAIEHEELQREVNNIWEEELNPPPMSPGHAGPRF